MLTQTGNPPRHPEMRLATASILVSLLTSPKVPSPAYIRPLLSNYSIKINCSKRIVIARIIAEGMTVMIS